MPLDQLSVEDLRLLIGQQIALGHTVPLALEILGSDPLASGDCDLGDRLEVTRQLPTDYWDDYPDQLSRLTSAICSQKLLGTPDET